jgi:ParB family protein of integrating conjugative element (PFGI_1 class)
MSKKRQIVPLHEQQNRPAMSKELTVQDPIQKMPMKVSILDIEPFDKNPRKHSNEAFEEIKESIRQKGLDQTFTITRRPGEPKYMIKAGGNTRLMALHQLYQETKDDKFLKIDVMFEPYVSEADTLISHLTENDLRGNLILIDRAQGIRDTQLALEQERGMKFSARELESVLKEEGYTIGRTVISVLTYALDRLYPYMPTALDAGMGKPQVESIRKFENQCREAWKSMDLNMDPFDGVFNRALAKADLEEKFDFEVLLNEFEEATCDATGQQLNTVRFYLEQAMRKRLIPANEKRPSQKLSPEDGAPEEEPEVIPPTEGNSEPNKPNVEQENAEPTSKHKTPTKQEELPKEEPEGIPPTEGNSEPNTEGLDENTDYTVQDLRAIALKTALKLAEDAHIEDLIIPIHNGYGWFLADVPQHIHFPNGFVEDDQAFKTIWRTWYTLFTLCGATSEARKIAASHIHQQNDLKRILNEEFDLLSGIGAYVSTAGVLNDFWEVSEEPVTQSAIDLIGLHRQITRLAKAVNLTLWKEVSDE